MDVSDRRALGSRYELVDRLGSGAMGEVWRTHDRTGDTWVAAKLLRSDLTQDTEIVGRFIQERSILLSLHHPGIVRVRDLVVEGDDLAIVMDLVEGEDLRAVLRRERTLPARTAVTTVAAVLDAVAAAHEQGCLHRDIKPDNVLVQAGDAPLAERVRLSDFGIARLAQESTVQATGLLGTPVYMPPELFAEGRFSGASDVYAAGVMLYELLAGRTPFAGPGTAHTIGFRHVTAEPPVLPVNALLWDLLRSMLSKDPTTRPSPAAAARLLRALPAEALSASAMVPQRDPEAWGSPGSAASDLPPAVPVRVKAEDELDVGATNIRGIAAPAEPLAAQGDVVALSPGQGAPAEDATNLARHLPTYAPPVLEPAAPTPEADRRTNRRWWIWGGVAAAVVLVVVLALVVFGLPFGGGSDEPASTEAVSASTEPQDSPSGLGVETSAEYDPASQTIDLSVELSADRATLDGDVLVVVPPLKTGGECPTVAWGGDVKRNLGRTTGILPECGGWALPAQLTAEDSVTYQASVTGIDLGADPGDALQQWLDRQGQVTQAAITDRDVTGTTAYALQRLTGLSLQVPSTLTLGQDDAVRVRLFPVFADGKPDELQPLYDSDSSGAPSSLLTAITGDGEVSFTPGPSCDGAVVASRGGDVVVRGQVDGCTLTGQVGNFDDVESNPLLVVGPNG